MRFSLRGGNNRDSSRAARTSRPADDDRPTLIAPPAPPASLSPPSYPPSAAPPASSTPSNGGSQPPAASGSLQGAPETEWTVAPSPEQPRAAAPAPSAPSAGAPVGAGAPGQPNAGQPEAGTAPSEAPLPAPDTVQHTAAPGVATPGSGSHGQRPAPIIDEPQGAETPESTISQDDVETARDERHKAFEDWTAEAPGAAAEADAQPTSRVSVVDEEPPRPGPPAGASEEEYKWHTYKVYPSGRPDAVEFIDLYKSFGRNKILRGLNMGLPEGMVSMILGPSGTGKSVCIKHMVGLLYPDQGDCLVHGQSVPNMVDDDLFEMRKKFGLLFQDGALFGSMNIYDNVAFPLRQHTEKGEEEIEDIVMHRLNEVGLGVHGDKFPNELSGGMRKRAGFARALVLEPDIVLFDEPDSGLDPVRTSLLGELILEVHRDAMDEAKKNQKPHLPTFCVITHNVMMARRTADYINVLWKGRIVEAGPTEDMLNSSNPFIRQFLAGESMGPLTMD